MNISGVQSQNTAAYQQVNKQQGDDPVIKNAQSQIDELRKQLQQLAENEEIDPKTKTEKKQQIQQQISDLNAQIRQRQAEIRKEKQASKENPQRTAAEAKTKEENEKASGFSAASTSALISASNSLDVADSLSSLHSKLKGRARELTSEIETDKTRGADITAKQSELDKVNKGVKNTAIAHAQVLDEADDALKNAAESDADALSEKESKNVKEKEEEEKEIKTNGMYDKDGNRLEDKDGESDFEDKA